MGWEIRMARYTDPICRQCRRIGEKLFLKGDRCYTPRCAVERRNSKPGEQVARRRRRPSNWAVQLKEKQKTRYTYGILERQFRNYFAVAKESPGITGDNLMQILERRLDNVVYRLCFADSRRQSRQLVTHGHFAVNDKKVSFPSYLVQEGDTITWKNANGSVPEFVRTLTEGLPKRPVPTWLNLNVSDLVGQVTSLPDLSEVDTGIDVRLVVEFYSR